MVGCTTCDGAVLEDTDTDHSKVFASIENSQLVFVVRGTEAVRRIFPRTPTRVVFLQTIGEARLLQNGPGDVSYVDRIDTHPDWSTFGFRLALVPDVTGEETFDDR